MSTALERALARNGKTIDDLPRNGKVSRLFRRDGVPNTADLRRVLELPTREWVGTGEWAEQLNELFRTPGGEQELWSIQVAILQYLIEYRGCFAQVRVGEGKGLAHGEPVLTKKGWRPIEAIVVGDLVAGSDGGFHDVLGVYPQGEKDLYRMHFTDGSHVDCDEDHLWTLDYNRRKTRTLQVKELLQEKLYRQAPGGEYKIRKFFLPMPEPFGFVGDVPWDAYTVGALLGDGCLRPPSVTFSTNDPEILGLLDIEGHTYIDNYDYRLKGAVAKAKAVGIWGKLSYEKEIPRVYMQASEHHRLRLLQGLFDTDGTPTKAGAVEFSSSSKVMASQVRELVWSLGGTATLQVKLEPKYTYKGETRVGRTAYRVLAKLPAGVPCFRLTRHLERMKTSRQRPPYRALDRIEPIGRGQSTCIRVASPDSLFVTRDGILTHNTLASFLAPLAVEAKRPVLLVPAHLKLKTQREFRDLSKHWEGHPDFLKGKDSEIYSYQLLGRVSGADILDKRKPDLIIGDEVHYLKNPRAAVTKRVARYMDENPETIFLAMSGTASKRSLHDYYHILGWCIGGNDFPLPFRRAVLQDWACALDEKVKPELRMDPGELIQFVPLLLREEMFDDDSNRLPDLALARRAFGKRLASTGGIVSSRGSMVDASLEIASFCPQRPPEIDEALGRLYKYWKPPIGEDCSEPVDVWRHARELACGFCYYWLAPGPDEWMLWRRRWGAVIRDLILADLPHLDSPFQIGSALKNGHLGPLGKLDDMGALGEKLLELHETWKRIKPTFKPVTKAHWISDYMLEAIKQIVDVSKDPLLIWVEHVAMGKRLSEYLDAPFFHKKGFSADKVFVDDYRGKVAILSIASNQSGRNLQHWRSNIVVTPPPAGDTWEQLIGRTHRFGQEADMVEFLVLCACRENMVDFDQAQSDCLYTRDTQLQAKKLGIATYRDRFYRNGPPVEWDDGLPADNLRDIDNNLDPWIEALRKQLYTRITTTSKNEE